MACQWHADLAEPTSPRNTRFVPNGARDEPAVAYVANAKVVRARLPADGYGGRQVVQGRTKIPTGPVCVLRRAHQLGHRADPITKELARLDLRALSVATAMRPS